MFNKRITIASKLAVILEKNHKYLKNILCEATNLPDTFRDLTLLFLNDEDLNNLNIALEGLPKVSVGYPRRKKTNRMSMRTKSVK